MPRLPFVIAAILGLMFNGCAETPSENTSQRSTTPTESVNAQQSTPVEEQPQPGTSTNTSSSSTEPAPELPVITFGGSTPDSTTTQKMSKPAQAGTTDDRANEIITALQDLQILLGTWRGITRKNFDGSKNVDETNWVWDFQTNPEQPALVMTSTNSPYYRKASLTYLPEADRYQLALQQPDDHQLELPGEFTEEIRIETGEDGKPQRSYKLQLTEQQSDENTLRFVINQQNNNRYLLEVYEQRGSNPQFFRVDTVSTQREGTSMALIDEGYGEKTCIISGGLGTMTVSFQGETYYVCCTGCKAAFEEDPERWIARAKEQNK